MKKQNLQENTILKFTQVKLEIEDIFLEYDEEEQKRILKTFEMPIPTHVVVHLSDDLINRIQKAAQICAENKFSSIEFFSKSKNYGGDASSIDLYLDDTLIELKKYTDFDKEFNVFDANSFTIFYESIYKKIYIQLLYKTSWTEFVFKTAHFMP